MIRRIGIEQVQQIQARGGQVVEVLARKEYDDEHIPNAINIPLLHMNRSSVAVLDRNRPVIVYCWDYE